MQASQLHGVLVPPLLALVQQDRGRGRGEGEEAEVSVGIPTRVQGAGLPFAGRSLQTQGGSRDVDDRAFTFPQAQTFHLQGAQSACSPKRHTLLLHLAHFRGCGLPVDALPQGGLAVRGRPSRAPAGKQRRPESLYGPGYCCLRDQILIHQTRFNCCHLPPCTP